VITPVRIGDRLVGPGFPTYIIAEAGVNHNGDIDLARKLVRVAAESGADAVKFQSFTAESLATASAPKAGYQLETTAADESQFEMLRGLELKSGDHEVLQRFALDCGILFLSTPFDEERADLLARLDVPAFKVSSGDLTNIPLIRHIAAKSKPIILSTGMACMEEVEASVRAIRDAGNGQIVLLQCVTNYPAEASDSNLRAMKTMESAFGVPVGYSDHTPGMAVPLAAVALGACIIEKHFTLDRTLPGPDHRASAEPDELRDLVNGIRAVESALGSGIKEPALSELANAAVARRSLFAAADLEAGVRLAAESIVMRRPGTGVPPSMLDQCVGRTLRVRVRAGEMLDLSMFS